MLYDPQRILEEAKHLNEQGIDWIRIEAVNRKIGEVEEKQRRLAHLYVEGSMPEDLLSSQGEDLKKKRIALESERKSMESLAPQAIDLVQLKDMLPDAAARVRQ